MATTTAEQAFDKQRLKERLDVLDRVFRYSNWLIPNPDNKFRIEGLKAYRKTLTDPTIVGCNDSIIQAINGLDRDLITYDATPEQIELYTKYLDIWFGQSIVKHIWDAVLYGYNPIDIVWSDDGKYFVPASLQPFAHESLHFIKNTETGRFEPRVLTEACGMLGESIPDYKTLIPVFNPTSENPYGVGLLSCASKTAFIKDEAINFWAIFVEDSGQPKIGMQISEQFVKKLMDEWKCSREQVMEKVNDDVKLIRQNGSFAYNESMTLIPLAVGTSDHGVTHNDLISYCDSQLSKLFLGHTGASESTPGKLGSENAAMSVLASRVNAYQTFVAQQINKLLSWIAKMNFGDVKPPEIKFYEKDDINARLQKVAFIKSMREIGIEFDEEYYAQELNIDPNHFKLGQPLGSFGGGLPQASASVGVATQFDAGLEKRQIAASEEPNDKEFSDILDTLAEFKESVIESEDFKEANAQLITSIVDFANQSDSIDDLSDNILHAYNKIDSSKFSNVMNRILLVSRLFGQENKET